MSAVIGRYLYEHVVAYSDLGTSETKTITNVAVVAYSDLGTSETKTITNVAVVAIDMLDRTVHRLADDCGVDVASGES